MTTITVKRKVISRKQAQDSVKHRSFRELARCYFLSERSLEFAIEALFFGIIVAISVWPIFTAANALCEFLQNAPG